MKITFASFNAYVIYTSMAEGMSEVQAAHGNEECVQNAADLDQIIARLGQQLPSDPAGFPATADLEEELFDNAQATLDNCLDNSSGADDDNPDELRAGDVVIVPERPPSHK